jgi:RNA recognition motif-containing protein
MEVFAGGLPWDVKDGDLEGLFKPFGEVARISVVRDPRTGEARGFGFVEMPNDGEARAAITALNQTELRGRTLRVSESLKSRGPYPTRGTN